MVDRTFEMELERQFAAAPILPDAELFALRVTERLDRGWTFRQMFIGGLGVAGGLIGAGQVLASGLIPRLSAVLAQSDTLMKSGIAQAPVGRGVANLIAMGTTMDGQILWMSAVLAALAVGLFVTRAIRDF